MPALGEVSEPVNRDSDVLLGNFCNVMVDVMPGSITYKLGFQALLEMISNCCCLVTQSCPTLCNFKDCSMPGSLSFSISWSSLKSMSIESVMPSNHLTLCCPLLLLPSVFPSTRVFSKLWPHLFRSPQGTGQLWLQLLQVTVALVSSDVTCPLVPPAVRRP